MDKQKAYKDKVNAEINEHAAKLAALKAKLKSEAADARVASMEKIHEIEEKLSHVKSRLADMGDVAEGSWEAIKENLENARKELSSLLKNLFEKHNEDKK